MPKLNKVENTIEKCPSCQQQMVCKYTIGDTEHPPKLQWQNDKGESHYLPPTTDAKGKTIFACRGYTTEAKPPTNLSVPASSTVTDLSKFKTEFVSKSEEDFWYGIVAKACEYTILAQKKIGEYPEIQNPALKGLVTKVAFKVLERIKDADKTG